jgi:hypothetical protein
MLNLGDGYYKGPKDNEMTEMYCCMWPNNKK